MRPWLVKTSAKIVPQWAHLESDFDVEIREVLSLSSLQSTLSFACSETSLSQFLKIIFKVWSYFFKQPCRRIAWRDTSPDISSKQIDMILAPRWQESPSTLMWLDVHVVVCHVMSCHFYVVMTCYVAYVMLCYAMFCYGMVVLCCFPWYSMDLELFSHVCPWCSNCFPKVFLFMFGGPNGLPMVVPCLFRVVTMVVLCSHGFPSGYLIMWNLC